MNHSDPVKPLHPISVVADRTGLSADLLRVWERRYGLVEPARDEGGRRLYSDSDIERLRLLGQATNAGRNISQLVDLDTPQLAEMVRTDEVARWRPAAVTDGESVAGYVDRSFQHTRRMDAAALDAELSRAAAVAGAARFLDSVIAPLFLRIGEGWHAGTVSISQEHLATGVAHSVMSRVRASLPVVAEAPAIVVATPAGERHEIGALLAAGAAALEGWRVTYLGADLPAAEIATAARDVGARVVALSHVYANGNRLDSELRALRDALPADVAIVLGGRGAATISSVPGVSVIDDLSGLRKMLASSR